MTMKKAHGELGEKFWSGRRGVLTGHTGFKGAWLSRWLALLGAEVTGYALAPETAPNLHELCRNGEKMHSITGDVRDASFLAEALGEADPDVVIHFAAQSLVLRGMEEPVETFAVNVLGTVSLLEGLRRLVFARPGKRRALLVITSDKCYENHEWPWPYRENDPLGGKDPYSASKACAEHVAASYRATYFPPEQYGEHGMAIATARAGNVIGGGDWARDRLVPDCMRAFLEARPVRLRNPGGIRPWQHVLEPLSGYLVLAERLCSEGPLFGDAWNFGPFSEECRTTASVVRYLCGVWGDGVSCEVPSEAVSQSGPARKFFHGHEAVSLRLDSSKAMERLGWRPVWRTEEALSRVVAWTKAYRDGRDPGELCDEEIASYAAAVRLVRRRA
jgi:CDP-glucose 4,6-dehydratase